MTLGRIMGRTQQKFRTAGRFVARFGARRGLAAYARIAAGKRFNESGAVIELDVPHSTRPVRIRPGGADAHAFWQVFIHGDYDLPIPFIPEIIVDAGAHVGYASLYFAHRFPAARIIAIEPAPANAEMLRYNLAGFDRVQVREAALWSTPRYLSIADPDAESWSFRIKEGESAGPGVAAITIPAILDDVGHIDILKVDIEGAEFELFSGDVSWLEQTRMVILELHEHYAPGCTALIKAAMQRHGFVHMLDKGENVVFLKD